MGVQPDDPFEAFAARMDAAKLLEEQANSIQVASVANPVATVDQLAEAWERAEMLIEAGKMQKAAAKAVIEAITRGQNDAELTGVNKRIYVTRTPNEGWDQDRLDEIFKASVPAYVKTKYEIPVSVWKKLPAEEQAKLISARAAKGETIKIEVGDK